jgi:hypothetical protein
MELSFKMALGFGYWFCNKLMALALLPYYLRGGAQPSPLKIVTSCQRPVLTKGHGKNKNPSIYLSDPVISHSKKGEGLTIPRG